VTGAEPNAADHFKLPSLVLDWEHSSKIMRQARFEKQGAMTTVYAVIPSIL
jgi:hypothetical protein